MAELVRRGLVRLPERPRSRRRASVAARGSVSELVGRAAAPRLYFDTSALIKLIVVEDGVALGPGDTILATWDRSLGNAAVGAGLRSRPPSDRGIARDSDRDRRVASMGEDDRYQRDAAFSARAIARTRRLGERVPGSYGR